MEAASREQGLFRWHDQDNAGVMWPFHRPAGMAVIVSRS
jgi:hypothetical protein